MRLVGGELEMRDPPPLQQGALGEELRRDVARAPLAFIVQPHRPGKGAGGIDARALCSVARLEIQAGDQPFLAGLLLARRRSGLLPALPSRASQVDDLNHVLVATVNPTS